MYLDRRNSILRKHCKLEYLLQSLNTISHSIKSSEILWNFPCSLKCNSMIVKTYSVQYLLFCIQDTNRFNSLKSSRLAVKANNDGQTIKYTARRALIYEATNSFLIELNKIQLKMDGNSPFSMIVISGAKETFFWKLTPEMPFCN